MSRKKLYFDGPEGERCYPLDWHIDDLRNSEYAEEQERVLYEAKRETGVDHFYCKEYFEVGLTKESCGSVCPGYKPNNGKNGRCAHYGYCYEATEKTITIRR